VIICHKRCKVETYLQWKTSKNHVSLSLQSSAVEQVLDILMDIMDILSWEIAEVVSPCLPRGL